MRAGLVRIGVASLIFLAGAVAGVVAEQAAQTRR